MADRATFLHITDAHVSASGAPFERDDRKVDVAGLLAAAREGPLELLFRRLAERLTRDSRTLDGVFFSGDAQSKGAAGGHELVFKLIAEHLCVAADHIVSVPGNHDVPRDADPGTAERYESFVRVWSAAGCVVPWLDGIDGWPAIAEPGRHRLVAADRSWAVFPINTSNWSHVSSVLPEPLRSHWNTIPETLAPGDATVAAQLRSQLQALARYDMARVSEHQLEALRALVASTPQPARGRQLRIAVMHHHLRSPSLREELKPFADMSNLEQVRAFLRGSGIGLVIHGHKHEHATYFDHIYAGDTDDMHRVLVISGATFEVGRETDAVRLITLDGLPHTPEVKIEAIPLPRSGAEDLRPAPTIRRLWTTGVRPAETVLVSPGAPVIVEGADLDEVYARALAIAGTNAKRGTLIVHLDLPDDDGKTLPLPSAYAVPDDLQGDERQAWLRELVEWWQLDRSQLEPRIPYLHGARLRRYGGKIDQIARIIALLRTKPSTRAIAVLVDPFRDFAPNGAGEEFASFCLIEFRRRDADAGRIAVDAIAFYRAQEFERWWPINIAELRFLQREICEELGYRPGRITTIAADARTISRSPTQVAMPIVDRWLDQAPERLHLLADALVHKAARGDAQASAVREWRRSLAELRTATNGFNSDGIPVAIEGLLTLAAYIEATATVGDEELPILARNLGDLARVNETFEHSTRSRAAFNRWSPVAQSLVSALERMTDTRLPDDRLKAAGGGEGAA
ncbi:metallophosphoesterase [Methylobacterium iners]|uniref:3',5'-cyclic adenosine monophosphate phosphodiesterase CpdA n=1 Tax=Methylobacterium iners TaxID=418707 RepID=A0ABQ4RUC2_9HYPH|nr:metallophosphoesterase [Methylobacterium iners]GJD94431.1 3',5'-cyclic adenosine monophosphate phosphodiesterase CpdA [Methylobacterium iners]